MPLGKNYRPRTKQMLNAPGNFCRVAKKRAEKKKDAGGGRIRRRPKDSKYADTIPISLPVLLNPCRTEPCQAVPFD